MVENKKMAVKKISYRYEMGDEVNSFGVLCQRAKRVTTWEGEWKEEGKEDLKRIEQEEVK